MRLARVYQVNPDLKKQLAQAFGVGSEAELEALIAKLRAGDELDPQVMRKACLALVDNARDAQAASDQRLKVALDASNLALWEWDLTTGNILVDRTYFGFLGLDRGDQLLPITELAALVSPEDMQVFRTAIADAVRGTAPLFQVQHRMRHADGRWVWIETSGTASRRDAQGRVTRMTGTNANITERKQLERALSNTLRVLRALLETLPLPVILRDAERRVTLVNEAFENMFGVSRHEIVGKPLDRPDHASGPQSSRDRRTAARRAQIAALRNLVAGERRRHRRRDHRENTVAGRGRHHHGYRLRDHRHLRTEASRRSPREGAHGRGSRSAGEVAFPRQHEP